MEAIRFSFKHLPTAEVEPQWKSAHAPCDVCRGPDEEQGHLIETLFKTTTAQVIQIQLIQSQLWLTYIQSVNILQKP